MKNYIQFSIYLLALGCLFITGCTKDTCTSKQKYIKYDPVYVSAEEMRKNLIIEAPKAIKQAGKIYYYDHFLMVNELNEGIHIIDNISPKNPKPVAFWKVKGNVDIAIKDGFMYLDQYADMVTYDIKDFLNPKFSCRRNDLFTSFTFRKESGYLIEYVKTNITEEVDCFSSTSGFQRRGESVLFTFDLGKSISPSIVNNPSTQFNGAQGQSGSFARFGFANDYLYAIDKSTLRPFHLDPKNCPVPQDAVNVGWDIETLFPYKTNLFIASRSGLHIFNSTNPAKPNFVSFFRHATGCDPVVVENNTAFVTVKGGTSCGGNTNVLDILDISDLASPKRIQSYPMSAPKGLGLARNIIYICDDGLKIYDRSIIKQIELKAHLRIDANDVIALGNNLIIVVGDDGYVQYDTSDPSNPKLLSKISRS
jgi:hypothetical protein